MDGWAVRRMWEFAATGWRTRGVLRDRRTQLRCRSQYSLGPGPLRDGHSMRHLRVVRWGFATDAVIRNVRCQAMAALQHRRTALSCAGAGRGGSRCADAASADVSNLRMGW